jgi:hypothetical protein
MNLEMEWTVYRTRFLVCARQLTEPIVFTDPLGREQSGRPGDYLVESSDGLTRITAKAIFEDIYVPMEPAPAHTPPAKVQTATHTPQQNQISQRIAGFPTWPVPNSAQGFPTRFP